MFLLLIISLIVTEVGGNSFPLLNTKQYILFHIDCVTLFWKQIEMEHKT